MVKVLSLEEAVALVKDNDTLCAEGFLINTFPEQLAAALEDRFKKTASPKNLTLFYCAGIGNGKEIAVNRFAHEGLLKRVIGGHYNLAPNIGKMVLENKIEAYNFPQGTIAQMYRDIAARKAGTISHVGLGTYVDPRMDGGKLNDITKEDLVELVTLNGEEQLFYKRQSLDVCFLRGTYADEKGNISMEKECLSLCNTSIAQAVKNNGGTVIVQVQALVKAGTLDPKLVKVPGIYVDAVVIVSEEENMWEVTREEALVHSGGIRRPIDTSAKMPLTERKVIGRRGAMELTPNSVVNLGIGVPEAVAAVANEEGIGDYMTLTVEPGPVGGIPVSGARFGAAINPECILDEAYQFDFYDGGGLDHAFLGLAECDEKGNINVSKMNGRLSGCGGFINITQNAKKVYFCGTFTAKGLKIAFKDGKLVIEKEGEVKKFLKKVEHVTFSGQHAITLGQPVTYITERAVFELKKDGIHLTEIAPGIDIDKHILPYMEFAPIINGQPKIMNPKIFTEGLIGLK